MGGTIKLKYSIYNFFLNTIFIFYLSYWLLETQPGGYTASQSDHLRYTLSGVKQQSIYSICAFYLITTAILSTVHRKADVRC